MGFFRRLRLPGFAAGFYPLLIGGGGQVLAVDKPTTSSPLLVTTDVGGAYIWNATTSQFEQLITTTRMPAGDVGQNNFLNGVYALASAPTDPNTIYMMYSFPGEGAATGHVYISTNGGGTFTRTTDFPSGPFAWNPNSTTGSNKFKSPKMAIDPQNKNIVICATESNGTFITSNGGTSWTKIPNVPTSSGVPDAGIVFDPSSTVTGGATQGIYVFSNGNGLYHSTNGGTAFSLIGGGPTGVNNHARISNDGVYYICDKPNLKFWKCASGTWTDLTANLPANTNPETVVIDPSGTANGTVIIGADGGRLTVSRDHGATFPTGLSTYPSTRVATDVPWLANTNESYLTIGDMIMDPGVTDKLLFAEGIGFWTTTAPTASTVTWTSQSAGIEELVNHWIISPPGGDPLACFSDRSIFRITNPDAYPSNHGPSYRAAIMYSSSCDWASADPTFIVDLCCWTAEDSAYSANGGTNWTTFPNNPGQYANGKPNGCIAASSANTIIYVPANDGDVWYTKDKGATAWVRIAASTFGHGMQDAGSGIVTGWHHAYFLNRQIVCADRVATDTFYIYNSNSAATGGGVYKITFPSGVLTVTQVKNGPVGTATGNNTRLRSVPNLTGSVSTSGHLLFTAGQGDSVTGSNNPGMYYGRESGGALTFTQVANTGECYAMGCGAVKPGNDYPSVYYVGVIGTTYGIYRSDSSSTAWGSNAQTWTFLGDFPLGNTDQVISIEGDANTYGKFYLGFVNGLMQYKP